MPDLASRLFSLASQALAGPLPVRIRAWDGSVAGPADAPAVVLRHRRALRRMLWQPGELGLARAWVAGEIDVEGDLHQVLDLLADRLWEAPAEPRGRLASSVARGRSVAALLGPGNRGLVREAVALAGRGLPPAPPPEESRRARGPRHTPGRDRNAISHHYDVGNEFYELVLGPSMVYSCAYWQDPGTGLEQAQSAKLDRVCRKLALAPGRRLLDVGCGWGSLALHAAQHYGVQVLGITLSQEQAAYARRRVAEAGLDGRVEIRLQDYRDLCPDRDGPFEAIASVGMAEHVGAVRYREYAAVLHALLTDGGLLLNHQIARRPHADEQSYRADPFIDHYVFPDGELSPIGTTVSALEQAGLEVRDVESLREHYALTLRCWVANLEENWSQALQQVTIGRARVWRLYMAASALAFEHNRIGVNQVLAVRPGPQGASALPLTRPY